MRTTLVFLLALLITACTDMQKADVADILDARDTSISQKNLSAYSKLLSKAYLESEGKEKVADMERIFVRFESVEMQSRDREIRILDGGSAICEQTYTLKVLSNGEWREIVQREQLMFSMDDNEWKISGGL